MIQTTDILMANAARQYVELSNMDNICGEIINNNNIRLLKN